MGLLDNLFNTEQGRLGLGLLAAGSARSDGAGFGQRLSEAVGSVDSWKQQQDIAKQRAMQQKMQEMQMAQMEAAQAKQAQMQALARQYATPAQPERQLAPLMGDSIMPDNFKSGIMPSQGTTIPAKPAGFDMQGYAQGLSALDPMAGFELQQRLAPKPDDYKVVGNSLVQIGKGGVKPVFSEEKPKAMPNAVQEYEYGLKNPAFNDWTLAQKKAGANSVSLKVDNKMGDSLAGQIGPMAKDSRIQTQGAVKMFDAADRLETALNSNKVTSGPFATQIQTAKQLIQVVGGGNDDSIRQTRQAIKSLAQMAVEARKQLQGQGQVTDSEASAVAKADAGEINDLTTGELRDLVTLTKRASHYSAKAHQDLIGSMEQSDATRGASKFYKVPGIETLLNHTPTMPQIGGSVRDQADAILRGK